MTAGLTFLGQFLDHDLTFDPSSRLGEPTRPELSANARTPALDLDSVYGGGFTANPQLYDSTDRAKFKVEHRGQFEDLPRGADGTAIIADPRNDENLMISGLQAALLLFHNRVVDKLREDGDDRHLVPSERLADGVALPEREEDDRRRSVFSEARRLVTWHYQWIIVNEFLPHIVGAPLVNDILSRGPRFYTPRPGRQSIPVEFSGAAYRFGHSMVRPSYRANLAGDLGQPFFGFVFDQAERVNRTPSTCVAARGRPGASSAGRRSSISAVTRQPTCGRPRLWTRRSRLHCSICHSVRFRAEIGRRRFLNAICSAT